MAAQRALVTKMKSSRSTVTAIRTGPRKKSKGQSFGMVPVTGDTSESPELVIPDLKDLPLSVKEEAIRIFAIATGETVSDSVDFAVEFEEELQCLFGSPIEIKYEGLRSVFEEVYERNDKKPLRQQSSRLKTSVAEILGLGDTLTKAVRSRGGTWGVDAAGLFLGSVGCSSAGRSSSTRPYLPLVGALLLLKYQERLIVGLESDRGDDEFIELAA